MENEEIVFWELSHLFETMNKRFSDVIEGREPNVFSTDPKEDALKIKQLMEAILIVLDMYVVPSESA